MLLLLNNQLDDLDDGRTVHRPGNPCKEFVSIKLQHSNKMNKMSERKTIISLYTQWNELKMIPDWCQEILQPGIVSSRLNELGECRRIIPSSSVYWKEEMRNKEHKARHLERCRVREVNIASPEVSRRYPLFGTAVNRASFFPTHHEEIFFFFLSLT